MMQVCVTCYKSVKVMRWDWWIQVSLAAWERKAQSKVIFVFNKLMWMACMCTSVAFIALSFIVVSHHVLWIAITVTIIGGSIILGTLDTMCYFAHRN